MQKIYVAAELGEEAGVGVSASGNPSAAPRTHATSACIPSVSARTLLVKHTGNQPRVPRCGYEQEWMCFRTLGPGTA